MIYQNVNRLASRKFNTVKIHFPDDIHGYLRKICVFSAGEGQSGVTMGHVMPRLFWELLFLGVKEKSRSIVQCPALEFLLVGNKKDTRWVEVSGSLNIARAEIGFPKDT